MSLLAGSAAGRPSIIAISCGEPAGIGPEITLQALHQVRQQFPQLRFVLLADRGMLTVRARKLGIPLRLSDYQTERIPTSSHSDSIEVIHLPLLQSCETGKVNPANARYVLQALDRGIQGARDQEFAALITAPVHKAVMNQAGFNFTGHTEYLAEQCGIRKVIMMLMGAYPQGTLRVALATTHLPLRDITNHLNTPMLLETLQIIHHDLQQQFSIATPKILVTGLNPHAGESGYLGREEIDIITPAIEQARQAGLNVHGPYAADTLFQPKHLSDADCVLAMYHDQGLPVLKYATFGHGINMTLGLPFIRLSVDHGTALELAGTGKADPGSLIACIEMAATMISQRNAASAVSTP